MPSAGMEQARVRSSYTPNGKPGSHQGFNRLFHNMKDVHTYIASYVSRHTNRSSCHGKHLLCRHGEIYSEVVNPYDETALACLVAMRDHHLYPHNYDAIFDP